jgi:hypothetical protein
MFAKAYMGDRDGAKPPTLCLCILELETFEKRHVFGPRTLMRTWGTRQSAGGRFRP